tara:strand:- start:989 stop:1237 length:249 start_codon:yes stop_codon:yes gene_type:complete
MNKIIIKSAMWKNGGSVGIAERNFTDKGVLVEILDKDKYGNKRYPHTYKISKENAMKCQSMIAKNNTALRVIPISEMEIVSE